VKLLFVGAFTDIDVGVTKTKGTKVASRILCK
jgi:hypothetical protein